MCSGKISLVLVHQHFTNETVMYQPITEINDRIINHLIQLHNTLMSLVARTLTNWSHVFLTYSFTWFIDVTLCVWIWISSEKDWCITWGSSQTKCMPLMCLVCMKARPAGVTHPAVPTIRDCMSPSSCIAVASSYTCNFSAVCWSKATCGVLILNCSVIFWKKLKKRSNIFTGSFHLFIGFTFI